MSELAIQNGVPEFRLCTELNWQQEADLYWVRKDNGDIWLCGTDIKNEGKKYAAPQVHHLLAAIPKEIDHSLFNISVLPERDYCIYRVEYVKMQTLHFEDFDSTNLSNSLAKLYIYLKKQNLF